MRVNLWANANTLGIQVEGVHLMKAGTFINNATVTATIEQEGVAVSGITQPVEIPYEEDTNGDYYAEIDHESNIEVGEIYTVNIFVVAGSRSAEFEMDIEAKKRPFIS